ncbi:MAG: hypothetical protein PHF63_00355 [Herbinix sp.]|nr:hypothetical protein [Herbinix sp.]
MNNTYSSEIFIPSYKTIINKNDLELTDYEKRMTDKISDNIGERCIGIISKGSSKFSTFQKREIELGISAGLDVSLYADPKYSCADMRQIRELLIREKQFADNDISYSPVYCGTTPEVPRSALAYEPYKLEEIVPRQSGKTMTDAREKFIKLIASELGKNNLNDNIYRHRGVNLFNDWEEK